MQSVILEHAIIIISSQTSIFLCNGQDILVQEWVEHAIIVFSMWEVVTNRGYKRAPCQNQRLKKRNLYASLFLGEMMQLRLALTFPSGPKGLGRVTKIDFKRKKNQKTIK